MRKCILFYPLEKNSALLLSASITSYYNLSVNMYASMSNLNLELILLLEMRIHRRIFHVPTSNAPGITAALSKCTLQKHMYVSMQVHRYDSSFIIYVIYCNCICSGLST